jgi:hypothetical protein
MKFLTVKNISSFFAAVGMACICTVAQAQSRAASNLDGFDTPMKSRTCGLVILSDGRAKVRAEDMERGMADLISAFALLQDGRNLEDKVTARTASQIILTDPPDIRTASIAKCKLWLEERKSKPDFSKTETDMWSWANQAQLTAKTEKK